MNDEPAASRGTLDSRRSALLAEQFVTLADSLVAEYDVVDLLERLVSSCVELLEVDQGGLLLTDQRGQLQVVAASSEATRLLELLQLQSDEGPCLECVNTGSPVSAPDLSTQQERWPVFAPAASSVGFTGVYALPLRLRQETIGALNLFSTQPDRVLGDHEIRVAQALADVATIGILQQRSISRTSMLAEQLQMALNSRVVIEQAKGVLAEHGGLEMSEAFEQLRTYARAHNEMLSRTAARVVRRQLAPDALQRFSDTSDT